MYQKILLSALASAVFFSCAPLPKYEPPPLSEDVQPPTLLEQVEPVYPQEAKEKGLEGTVIMYFLVSNEGEVIQTKVAKSSGYNILDNTAVEYAKKLKFNPAEREGEPTGIWITWMITYYLERMVPYFMPGQYGQKIKDLYRIADQRTGKERQRIIEEILNTHEEYVGHLKSDPDVNYNIYIREFVKPEISEYWKDFWQDYPLLFVVYHDFILRYPDSDKISYATARMLDLIKDDIERIKVASKYNHNIREKKDLFLKTIYMFLNEEYPQGITEDLKPEAEKFLKED